MSGVLPFPAGALAPLEPFREPRTITREELRAMAAEERATAQREAPTTPRGDLEALARSFPTLRRAPAEFFGVVVQLFGPRDPSKIGFAPAVGRTPHGSILFAQWCAATGGGGQRDAGLFLLSVWGGAGEDWSEWLSRDEGWSGGRFECHRALGNWDAWHRAAFLRWAADPWWL